MVDNRALSTTDVGKVIDAGIEDLRWCRQHLGERGVPEKLPKLELSLAALSLALDYEMDGQHAMANQALEKADWQVRPHANMFFDPHAWDH